MILPTFLKRRTSRRTSKRRQKLSKTKPTYDSLEPRNLLATFVVTLADDVIADDGQLSLREAVIAANTNEAFSDAPAGDVDGDRIVFRAGPTGSDPSDIQLLTQGELEITDDLVIVGRPNEFSPQTQIESGFTSRIFNVNTTEPVQLRRLAIVTGSADAGGNILVQPGGDLSIVDSYVGGGQANRGGGIVVDSANLFAFETTFQGNAAGSGGAIQAVNGASLRFNRATFLDNSAFFTGGGIHAIGGSIAAYSSVFGDANGSLGNRAVSGGAIALAEDAIFVSDSSFFGNIASRSGGAIHSGDSSSVRIFGGSFVDNGFEEGDFTDSEDVLSGGAITAAGEQAFISNAEFRSNRAGRGGAVFSRVDGAVFGNLDFDRNIATITGGGLYLTGTSFISDSQVRNNLARGAVGHGGGIAQFSGSSSSTVVLRRVDVTDNFAGDMGGGINVGIDSTMRIFNSRVSGNQADGSSGGGISNNGGDLLITNAVVFANHAAGESSRGGGVHSVDGSILLFDSTINNNTSSQLGGGLFMSGGFVRFANSSLSVNSTGRGGGGAFVDSGKLVFVGGVIESNSAVADLSDSFQGQGNGGGVVVGQSGQFFARAGTVLAGNRADAEGGGISSVGLINIQDSRIRSNSANIGGGIHLGVSGRAFIENTNVDFNTVTQNGSAIFGAADSILVYSNSLVRDNSVSENSNGIPVFVVETAFSRLDGNLFRNNTPLNESLSDSV